MAEEDKKKSVELRSEEVKDILGHVPHWIIRWGMALFLLCIALILAGSWIIRYPYIVRAKVQITTENPPSNAVARTNGRIEKLFVKDNEFVKAGQLLALIENTSDFNDIVDLKIHLDSFQLYLNSLNEHTVFRFPANIALGDIQPLYAGFLRQYEDLRNFIQLDYHEQKINSIHEEIKRYKAYSWTLKKQSNIIKGEENLVQRQFSRDSLLFMQGVIPEADYEKSKSALLQKQRAYEESRSILVNNEIQISKLEQQILDLELQQNEELNKLQLLVIESFDNLMAGIAEWEQNFVLRSNLDGIISFTRIWSENQNVREGEVVMTIIPEEAGDIIGKIDLPVDRSGKVETDQLVNIKLANYPYMEYGMLKGKVVSISRVANNEVYSVLVHFPQGLTTTYNTDINFTQDMQGQAEIITDEQRLLERIVNPVKSVISRQRNL